MPVTIDEFEVVDSSDTRPRASDARESTSSAPAQPDPEDLRRTLSEQHERLLRRWSH